MGTSLKNIIVSGCLIGNKCRYDGSTNKDLREILKDKCNIVAVCPEQMGGLSTPRVPAERIDDKVINKEGLDVTKEYTLGAKIALKLAVKNNCRIALLKAKSPSCGSNEIYDGTFSHTLIKGDGVTADLFKRNGIKVYTENELNELFIELLK